MEYAETLQHENTILEIRVSILVSIKGKKVVVLEKESSTIEV